MSEDTTGSLRLLCGSLGRDNCRACAKTGALWGREAYSRIVDILVAGGLRKMPFDILSGDDLLCGVGSDYLDPVLNGATSHV
jgi:hypothetical protein